MTDEITYRLTAAMMLLEMFPDTPAEYRDGAVWAVHDLVQSAWQMHAGHHPVKPLSEDTQILLSTIAASTAIEDAKDREKS